MQSPRNPSPAHAATAAALVGVGLILLMLLPASMADAQPPVPAPPVSLRVVMVPAPTVTEYVTKTPKPRPTKTIIVTRTAQPASRSYTRPKAGSPATTAEAATMRCIRAHESGGRYTAVSPTGYQGAYQLSPTYSGAWAKRYGYGAYAGQAAHTWPPAVQDAVALGLGRDSHWKAWSDFTSYSCPGFVS